MNDFVPTAMICWTCEDKTKNYHRITAKTKVDYDQFFAKHEKHQISTVTQYV